jgi:ankyrin repeat protein
MHGPGNIIRYREEGGQLGGTMKNMHSFFSQHRHLPIPHRAALTLVALVALAWSSPAFCGDIHDAARDGDFGKVAALLKHKPGLVSSKDDYGSTPLHVAVYEGHKNVAELLLAKGAEVNATDIDGSTPLHVAAYEGHKGMAELLLANKAKVNARDRNGQTPLHEAAVKGYKDVVELLLANGADVNAKANNGVTPLHWAAFDGHENVVALLRQHSGHE